MTDAEDHILAQINDKSSGWIVILTGEDGHEHIARGGFVYQEKPSAEQDAEALSRAMTAHIVTVRHA